ncbi:ATP-dependent DNA helicase DinG [Aliivibrio fischeri]|uniref:ATP-dependent DNA helicase DinG n=1 Tax=Aliivibrio fischeri TaxID=668 RepID=UPI0007C48679|nr:ATP-dependent DNA helicase DinG [Aliivibrio fischeri]
MLNKSVTDSIRQSYKTLQDQLPGFIPRRAQNYLVAEIAKSLAGEYSDSNRMIVAEAGTGIGKSLAYLLSAIPYAKLNNKKVVISTATVALQEQLAHKDLPFYRRISPLPFSFIIAKGRQRYCCSHKLSLLTESNNEDDKQVALFTEKPKKKELDLLKRMYKALAEGKWDGDIDSWPTTIPSSIWQSIVSDKYSCHNGLPMHRECPFQKAREHLDKADVVIANHSLVMADIDLGGGVVLSEPEQTIYIFDEAHHLPNVAREHSSAAASLKGSASWLESLNKSVSKFCNLADQKRVNRFQNSLHEHIQELIPTLNQLSKQFDPTLFNDDGVYRFEHGEIPNWLAEQSKELKEVSTKANQALAKISDLISERMKDGELAPRMAEPALAEIGFYLQRLENLAQVWFLMAKPNSDKGAPLARWLEKSQDRDGDTFINVSPLEVGWQLDQNLWSRAAGAVVVSATMRALNSYSFFCKQAGISEKPEDGVRFLSLASPFNYQENAQLVIPKLPMEPSASGFTDLLIEELPFYLADQSSSLVLFSSYWQMNKVAEGIEKIVKKHGWNLLIQGQESRQEILKKHKKLCDENKISILFGTGSFSEGLDLPGNLLTNLIITKIPFGVPTSPVEEAHSEYIESRGGNPFMQISVPEASKKLIQSVGRLLRKEEDSGRVVLLDRRVITKRYGKALLDALPPFKRLIE